MLSKNDLKVLRKLHHKKYREERQQFVAEGPKTIGDLLRTGLVPFRVFTIQPGVHPSEVVITPAELQQISLLETPNQAVAIFEKPHFVMPENLQRVLLLDGIRDPGNMGTLLRLADWFGLDAVFCSADCVEVWNHKSVQASMGSLGRTPIFQGSWPDLMGPIQKAALPIFGTFLDGASVYHSNKPEKFALAMGSESHGIGADLSSFVTHKIHIPRHVKGQAESLNVAMACGIVLGIWGGA